MSKSYGFGPQARLSSRRRFQRVFAEGRKIAGRNMILWYRLPLGEPAPPEGGARLGLSVSSKVGGAVLRNRLKRLAREAFRLNRPRLKSGSDLVVYLRPGCRWQGFEQAERDLMEACRRAGLVES